MYRWESYSITPLWHRILNLNHGANCIAGSTSAEGFRTGFIFFFASFEKAIMFKFLALNAMIFTWNWSAYLFGFQLTATFEFNRLFCQWNSSHKEKFTTDIFLQRMCVWFVYRNPTIHVFFFVLAKSLPECPLPFGLFRKKKAHLSFCLRK